MRPILTFALLALAIAIVLLHSGSSDLVLAAQQLSWPVLAATFLALLLNGVAAAWRLQVIARDLGTRLSFVQALAAVSAGSIGGAAFFQLAGQLIARGGLMARSGIDFSSVVAMTLYERAVAAILSLLLALAGAFFIFGRIYLDPAAGGAELIKIVIGLFAATAAGAFFGYRQILVRAIPHLNRNTALRFLRALAMSILVQAPMILAYVIISRALAPTIDLYGLFAASAIVMFAASIPISLAGWGVREVSAVFALGAVGIASSKALVAAIAVGLGSFLAMVLLALLTVGWRANPEPSKSDATNVDLAALLRWALPLGTATLVLFQVYVPISSGTLLNVNLADPLAILGGSIFVLACIQARQPPRWRDGHVNHFVIAATLVLTVSLLIGIGHFGVTEWAWINRYLGWFVLLAYGATGAMIVRAESAGLTILLRTYAAATAAVVLFDLALMIFGIKTHSALHPGTGISGFAQNRNFLAFQTLMAIAALAASEHRPAIRTILLTIFMTGLWFAGSRSGWIALVAIMAVALYLRALNWREVAISVVITTMACLALAGGSAGTAPQMLPTMSNTGERLLSITGGWKLFLDHPLLGAGLGAFRNLGYLSTSKLPLLIHSSYVWLLAETGIVGFCIFVGFAGHILASEFRRKEEDAARILIILCLIAFAVMSLPADMIYQRTFWLLLGAALASASFQRNAA